MRRCAPAARALAREPTRTSAPLVPSRGYTIMDKYRHLNLRPIPDLPAAIASKIPKYEPPAPKKKPPPPPLLKPGQARMTERDKAVAEVLYKSKNAAAAAAANAAGGASVFQPPSANPTPRPLVIPPLPRESSERKEPDQPEDPRSLTVALIGAPNAGKSTLVNQITNAKISAVSPKAQTTRRNILGINTHENVQLAFFDTPGIVPVWQQKQVVRDIVTSAWHAAFEADMLLYLVDAAHRVDEDVLHTVAQIRKISLEGKHQLLLVLNKADLVTRDLIMQRVNELSADNLFHDVFVVSALKGINTDSLLSFLRQRALPREWDYHSSVVTTQSDRERAMEIIREQVFIRFNQEIPYMIKLVLRSWVDFPNGDLGIEVVLLVAKSSHKAMVIGSAGSALKMITTHAGANLSEAFKRPVKLFISVKVDKEATERPDVSFETPGVPLGTPTVVQPKKRATM